MKCWKGLETSKGSDWKKMTTLFKNKLDIYIKKLLTGAWQWNINRQGIKIVNKQIKYIIIIR